MRARRGWTGGRNRNWLKEEKVLKCYYVIASRGDWTHKETGSGDPVMFLWCTFPKGFDLGLLCVFRFVELAKEGFVERLADIHISSDQFVEN
jgi:hypothetical protein